jgi:lipopolysaccharide transport system ATP-binding protein
MSDIVIKAENIGKLYKLGEIGTGTISHDLNRWWARMRGKEDPFAKIGQANDRTIKSDNDWVWALKDVNFEVKQGEVLGIIGRNGAGKSTLLKILSKVTTPTTGRIKVKGRIASLLEVGTGFHPELTGRENIFLNGAILGMTKAEIRSKFDEIVDFAGVERYIDTPVKRYSSGMYVRLAFAVAAFLEPEILIIDEVLAVGDTEFQKKCIGRMKDVSTNDGRTVLFVSHNMAAVKSLCTKGIVLKHGGLTFSGNEFEAVQYYQNLNETNSSFQYHGAIEEAPGNNNIRILEMSVNPQEGELLSMLSGVEFQLKIYNLLEGKNIDVTFEVSNNDDVVVFHRGLILTENNSSRKGVYDITCRLPKQFFNAGMYNVKLIFGESQRYLLYEADAFVSFEVMQEMAGSNSGRLPGITFPELSFKVEMPD